jgi:hypothetical protein
VKILKTSAAAALKVLWPDMNSGKAGVIAMTTGS